MKNCREGEEREQRGREGLERKIAEKESLD